MFSIIIPAHNEEQVIGSTLDGLFPGIDSGEFEVIVVCNACSDNTAGVVRSCSEKISCIEVYKPSKTNALNVGDGAARYFPRVYLDADIRIATSDILAIVRTLEKEEFLAVAPAMKMDLTHSSWLVRAYYDVWSELPYCREGMIGVGIYALSEEGRARFGAFPDIIADDGYVRLHFMPKERGMVDNVFSLVTAPSHIFGLIKIKTRSRLGEYELQSKFPELFINDNKDYSSAIVDGLVTWSAWPKIFVYLLVNVFTRLRAKSQKLRAGYTSWERDESSRKIN